MEEDEHAIEHVHDESLRELADEVHDADELDEAVRMIFRYEGETHEVAYVREDVDEAFTDDELNEKMKTLAMKGLGDPPREQSLYDFGDLESTVRWFEDAVVAYFPDEEWSGVIMVFDRVESPLVDVAMSTVH